MNRNIFILVVFMMISVTLTAGTRVIAHRGYWKQEGSARNSISSLRNAQALGVYGSELDVHITSDNRVIVCHDDSFHGYDINTTTYAQLKDLKLENGEVLPTLDAYLSQAQENTGTKLIIEIKQKKDTALENRTIRMVVGLVRKYKMEGHIEYISFSLNACKELVKLTHNIPIAYLASNALILSPAELKKLGISGLDYHYSLLLQKPEWIAQAKELGLTANAWTVNDPAIMQKLIDLGIDFITTDEPVKALELLAK
jgi:glycerophosphoryl diester phosphodiesterase